MLILLVAVTGHLSADIAFTLGSRQAVLVVQDTPFEPAVQLLTRVAAGTTFQFAPIEAGFEVGLSSGLPSAVTGALIYRGFAAVDLALHASWATNTGFGATLRAGLGMATYLRTRLLFVMPIVEISPHWRLPLSDDIAVEWALPISAQVRRDVTYAVAIGVSGGARLRFASP